MAAPTKPLFEAWREREMKSESEKEDRMIDSHCLCSVELHLRSSSSGVSA